MPRDGLHNVRWRQFHLFAIVEGHDLHVESAWTRHSDALLLRVERHDVYAPAQFLGKARRTVIERNGLHRPTCVRGGEQRLVPAEIKTAGRRAVAELKGGLRFLDVIKP